MLPPPIRGVVVTGVVVTGVADVVADVVTDVVEGVVAGASVVVVIAAASSLFVVLCGVLVSSASPRSVTEVVSKPPSTGAIRDLASVHSRRLASTGTGRCPNIQANSSD